MKVTLFGVLVAALIIVSWVQLAVIIRQAKQIQTLSRELNKALSGHVTVYVADRSDYQLVQTNMP